MVKKISGKKPMPKVSAIAKLLHLIRRIALIRGFLPLSVIIAAGLWFESSGNFDKTLNYISDKKSNAYTQSGLVLQDILLEGQNHSNKEDILQAITLGNSGIETLRGMPLMDIDLYAIKERLEKLAWVDYAAVDRQLPSTLSVSIVEKIPVALWQNGGKLSLLDALGHVIVEDDLSNYRNLVILIGDDIEYSAEEVLGVIASSPILNEMVSSAIRIGNRRWNVRLKNNIEIKLPEKNAIGAWKYLEKAHLDTSLLTSDVKSVDLRVAEKVFVE